MHDIGQLKTIGPPERRRAHSGPDIYPVYQPIVDMASGCVVGYEGLSRFVDGTPPLVAWRHAADDGEGSLVELELEALARAVDGAHDLMPDSVLSVNLSPVTIQATAEWIGIIDRAKRRIVLELTEHDPVDDYTALRRVLDDLPPNVLLAIDDYGTGYCRREHFVELRPAVVKMPRCAAVSISKFESPRDLARVAIDWFIERGAVVVAEGIETEHQWDVLVAIGVRYGQGYLFGRPEPADLQVPDAGSAFCA